MMLDQVSIPSDVDFITIPNVVVVDAGALEAWRRIGAFATAGRFLNVPSKLLSGDGGIGSVRQIGDAVIEAMVGAGDTSYAYVQTKGPVAQHHYHGSVALSAVDASKCTLTYTILYDQTAIPAGDRVEFHERLAARFKGAAEAMKRVAEGGELS